MWQYGTVARRRRGSYRRKHQLAMMLHTSWSIFAAAAAAAPI